MAVTITAQDVRDLSLAGDFDCLTDAQIDAVIADAVVQVNDTVCPDLAPVMAKNLVAHMLTLRQRTAKKGGPAGPVVSQSAGGMSRSYAAPGTVTASSAYFAQTPFGQEYLRLVRICPGSPLTLNTRNATGLYDSVP